MKFLQVFLFLMLFGANVQAQKSISLLYNIGYLGDNVSVNHGWQKGRHHVAVGMKYHINTPARYFNGNINLRMGYAAYWYEHLGLNATYEYSIKPKNWKADLRLMANTQLARLGTRSLNGDYVRYRKPEVTLEQTVGLSSRLAVTEYIDLSIGGGLGAAYTYALLTQGNQLSWNFFPQFSIGLSHHLN